MFQSKEFRDGQGLNIAAPGRLTGYAAVFGSESVDLGGFKEVIRAGAFSRSLKSGENIQALWQHDGKSLLGTTKAGTLRLNEDAKGLRFEIDLPDTTTGRDLGELVSRGDVNGCSFGFIAQKDQWTGDRRELIDVDLFEITITPSPAYLDTEVAKRSRPATRNINNLWFDTV
jgi:HK97 family phage prohead protease